MDPVKEEILIVLGSPNSPSGVLGGLAISRLDYCLTQYKKGVKILCTGGWGPHFNVSENSHASYAENYLLDKGVGKEDILESVLSENTVDDAVKSKAILADFPGARLMVITSDFHVERVTLIFAEILNEFEINFVGVESKLDRDLLHSLIAHEKEAIASIRKHGLYY